MSIFKHLLQALGLGTQSSLRREFNLDEDLYALLYDLADLEQRPVDEVAGDLIQQALSERRDLTDTLRTWHSLSPRQQQIAALVCLDYTNQQIAARLSISPETVKSHVRVILNRFEMRSKVELSRFLSNWDFSAWDV